ncbi:hypothetical protein Tco_0648407, partial [Tanacetum coccineum]
MPSRPKKNRVNAPCERNTQVSRVGRQMTCNNCYEKGHNKRARDTEPVPKPPKVYKQPGRRREPDFSHYASNKGGGRGSRGVTLGGRGETSGVRGETSQTTKGIHGTNKGDQTEGTLSGASRVLMIVTSDGPSINIRHLEKATVSTGKEGLLSEGNALYNWSSNIVAVTEVVDAIATVAGGRGW